ncbi:MAG TPA: hypothetical protein VG675_05100 [Bryobacteraceae bacterium]|nr:hypothetical protein [Bryobacteraceae bacterium]
MVKFSRIIRDHRDCRAVNALLNIHCAVDEHTFLAKGGELLRVLRAKGVDYECLDHSQLDRVARRFESAVRNFSADFRIYQVLLKRDHAPLPYRHYENAVVEAAIQDRIEYLRRNSESLYTLDLFLVFCYEGWSHHRDLGERARQIARDPVTAFHDWLSHDKKLVVLESELARAREVLRNKVAGFLVQMEETLGLELLDKQDAFRSLFCRLLNYAPHKSDSLRLRHDRFVDYQAANSALECYRDHLKIDDFHAAVLSLKEPPAQTFPNMFRALQELPANFVAVTEWKREDNLKMRRAIQTRRRHHHVSKSSFLNYVWGSQPARPDEVLVDDSEAAHVADLGRCLHELEINGNYFGQFSLTVILYDRSRQRLERSVAECSKVFSTHDAVLIEERYNLLNAWLAAVPGNHLYNLRRMWLLNTNYADLSFLFTQHSGELWNRHLDREYLAILETNHGAPYFLNLHYQDIAHTIMLGATGSGKSFLLAFLLTHLQKYDPYTFIFDLGGGYEGITRLFDGCYLKVGMETRGFTINPFSLDPTPENLHFLFSFVRVLIESNGFTLENRDERDLYEAIGNLYEVPAEIRRLRSLLGMVRKPLAERLSKWAGDGQYGALFDNCEDNLTFARFQAFDLEGMDKYPAVVEPLLFYILHRASAAIYDRSGTTTSKWFVMDEAWRFFRHPTIKLYIVEALKTWRKHNAAMLLATQSGEDLQQSQLLPIIAESCATRIFLSNPGIDREAYQQTFHLNETEAALIAGLVPKQQILIKRPDLAKVANLKVDPKGYWLYTNSPFDNQRRREAIDRFGFREGLEALALQGAAKE